MIFGVIQNFDIEYKISKTDLEKGMGLNKYKIYRFKKSLHV